MKIADGLKLIENGWIRKPKGFRVRFHRLTDAAQRRDFAARAFDVRVL